MNPMPERVPWGGQSVSWDYVESVHQAIRCFGSESRGRLLYLWCKSEVETHCAEYGSVQIRMLFRLGKGAMRP